MLILFIDGYPYYLSDLISGEKFPYKIPHIPNYGYSVTLHYEIFQGISPNELGYLGEWIPIGNPTRNAFTPFQKVMNKIRFRFPFASRVIYKILRRQGFFPLGVNQLFVRKGSYLLMENREIIIGRTKFKIVSFDEIHDYIKRDEKVFRKAFDLIKNHRIENIIVAFTGLDSVSHKRGVLSEAYLSELEKILYFVDRLYDAYKKNYPNKPVVFISDHGMSDAETPVNLRLEERIGYPDHSFVYLYDSLYLYVWNFNNNFKYNMIINFLKKMKCGKILTQDERQFFRIDSPRLGDLIFVLNEGYYFRPNYFGLGNEKALHGYGHTVHNQYGVLALSEAKENFFDEKKGIYTKDIYRFLLNLEKIQWK